MNFGLLGLNFLHTTHTAHAVLAEMECDSLMGFACFLFLVVGSFVLFCYHFPDKFTC